MQDEFWERARKYCAQQKVESFTTYQLVCAMKMNQDAVVEKVAEALQSGTLEIVKPGWYRLADKSK